MLVNIVILETLTQGFIKKFRIEKWEAGDNMLFLCQLKSKKSNHHLELTTRRPQILLSHPSYGLSIFFV